MKAEIKKYIRTSIKIEAFKQVKNLEQVNTLINRQKSYKQPKIAFVFYTLLGNILL